MQTGALVQAQQHAANTQAPADEGSSWVKAKLSAVRMRGDPGGPMMLARRFGNAAILHAGRTGRLAGAAEKAEIQVIFETIIKLDATIGGGFHQMNPAARRFGLQP